MTLVLASNSAARRAMLRDAGVVHEAMGSGVDEDALKAHHLANGAGPAEIALFLAEAKAASVSKLRPGLVLGADQTLDLGGALFDKAENLEEARRRLLTFRGRRHVLHSAAALARDGAVVWRFADQAQMIMRDFSGDFLDAYLAAEGQALLSSVGCYRLEGLGAQLFDRVQGDYFTVLGMPLWPLLEELRRQGILQS